MKKTFRSIKASLNEERPKNQSLDSFFKKIEQQRGKREQIEDDMKRTTETLNALQKELSYSEKAQTIIQVVAKQTQSELEYRIVEPATLAQAAVYEDNYKQIAEFKITGRGNTECHLGFERDGNVIKPFEGSGGGPVDISAYALRLGSLSLSEPRSRPVLILDEPFRFVSKVKMPLAGQMLKETSHRLKMQIIMVTHIEELIEYGDKIIKVKIENGKSQIEE